jgi:hypothetical protein
MIVALTNNSRMPESASQVFLQRGVSFIEASRERWVT